ncbi:hypothetical protein BKA62DRAFT_61441 [Auriculariales sp. MPI-PUGE-AT-0066]|nr:hypothetical protein BKA62DRAFT_61441 [Auriculariales sp. MPI-PUGE-AT-0066]
MNSRLRLVLALPAMAHIARAISYTTCKDPSVTWYNNADGLNPCQQYEKLRQLCDPRYEVPQISVSTPGNTCDSQRKDCCCNSVAFSLSMLCLNCQQGFDEYTNGIDAGKTAYGIYLNSCGPGTNETLPEIVQAAVCNQGIKLNTFNFKPFWPEGDWYYRFTEGVGNDAINNNSSDAKICDPTQTSLPTVVQHSTPASTSTITEPSSSAAPSTPSSQDQSIEVGIAPNQTEVPDSDAGRVQRLNMALLLGTLIGGLAAVILLIALIQHLLKERKKNRLRQSQRPMPDPAMLEAQSRPWTPFSDAPTRPSTERHPFESTLYLSSHESGSTSRVALFHPAPSLAPPPSSYRTSDSYSTFVPPASSRSPSPPLPTLDPSAGHHRARSREARVPLLRSRDTMSTLPSYR